MRTISWRVTYLPTPASEQWMIEAPSEAERVAGRIDCGVETDLDSLIEGLNPGTYELVQVAVDDEPIEDGNAIVIVIPPDTPNRVAEFLEKFPIPHRPHQPA